MRRKIIRQKESYTITLPKKWIIHNNISENDEIEIENKENSLLINVQNSKQLKKIELHFKESDLIILESLILVYYSRGYDLIEVTSESELPYYSLHKAIENINGVLILEYKPKYILLECGTNNKSNISSMIDKLFISVNYIFKLLSEKSETENISSIYNSNRMLKNYLSRIINENQYGDVKKRDYEFIIFFLSRISNIIHKISLLPEFPNIDFPREFFENIQKSYLKKDLKLSIKLTDEIAKYRRKILFDDAINTLLIEYLFMLSSHIRSVMM